MVEANCESGFAISASPFPVPAPISLLKFDADRAVIELSALMRGNVIEEGFVMVQNGKYSIS